MDEPRPKPKPEHCRSCGAPIRWTVTASGRFMPLDWDTPTSHFATCPQAAAWRKPKRDEA